MESGIIQTSEYIKDILNIHVAVREFGNMRKIPRELRDEYSFYEFEMLGSRFLLVLDRDYREKPPGTVAEHFTIFRELYEHDIVYVRLAVSSFNRKRLIEQNIQFIIPGNQLYLPSLGMDLREYFKKVRQKTALLSPAAQLFMLKVFLEKSSDVLHTPGETASRLNYSNMSMTRAFDELESLKLGTCIKKGRKRYLRFEGKAAELWEKALPYFRSPVRNSIVCRNPDDLTLKFRAGLSALAEYTGGPLPECPVFAVSPGHWKSLFSTDLVREAPFREPGMIEIQVWSYDPALFADDRLVDRLSLYLSLEQETDAEVRALREKLVTL